MRPKVKIPKVWLEKFCKKQHIIKISLLGSVIMDHFNEASDIDMLVEFDPPAYLNTLADLRTPEDISKLFRNEVIQQSYPIYVN